MGLWQRIRARLTGVKYDSLDLWRELFGNKSSATGKAVNWQTALQVTAVLACARVIAEGIAQVPWKLMRESADGRTRAPATEHPLYRILHRRPNAWQTSFEFRETLAFHVVLCGNHFSFVNRPLGRVTELIPIEPGRMSVRMREDNTLAYEVTAPNGQKQTFPAEAIWHVRGPSWNSWMGLEAVSFAREAIGLAMLAEEHHAKLHSHMARVGGVLSVEGALGKEQYDGLRKWVEQNLEGPTNAYRTMIVDRGAKFSSATQTGKDSEHLETRRYQVEEICRALRVMPIMIGYSDKTATYASAEQMFLAHVVHTLSPWFERLEQSADENLLTERERRQGMYTNFVEEGLLRGASKDTKDVLLGYVNGGLMTPNEGRAKLDLNPDSDPASDKLRIPVNVAQEPQDTTPEQTPDDSSGAGELEQNAARAFARFVAPAKRIARLPE